MSAIEERAERVKSLVEVEELLNVFDIRISERQDGELRLLCPLPNHNDTEPSFSFNVFKKVFNCFGCEKQGDIITFVIEMKKFSFMEALEFLEELAVGSLESEIEIHDRIVKRESLVDLVKKGKLRVDKLLIGMDRNKRAVKISLYVDIVFSYFLHRIHVAAEGDLQKIKKEFLSFFRTLLKKFF